MSHVYRTEDAWVMPSVDARMAARFDNVVFSSVLDDSYLMFVVLAKSKMEAPAIDVAPTEPFDPNED